MKLGPKGLWKFARDHAGQKRIWHFRGKFLGRARLGEIPGIDIKEDSKLANISVDLSGLTPRQVRCLVRRRLGQEGVLTSLMPSWGMPLVHKVIGDDRRLEALGQIDRQVGKLLRNRRQTIVRLFKLLDDIADLLGATNLESGEIRREAKRIIAKMIGMMRRTLLDYYIEDEKITNVARWSKRLQGIVPKFNLPKEEKQAKELIDMVGEHRGKHGGILRQRFFLQRPRKSLGIFWDGHQGLRELKGTRGDFLVAPHLWGPALSVYSKGTRFTEFELHCLALENGYGFRTYRRNGTLADELKSHYNERAVSVRVERDEEGS